MGREVREEQARTEQERTASKKRGIFYTNRFRTRCQRFCQNLVVRSCACLRETYALRPPNRQLIRLDQFSLQVTGILADQ